MFVQQNINKILIGCYLEAGQLSRYRVQSMDYITEPYGFGSS